MELKLPPALVVFIFAFAMYLLSRFLPFGYFDFFGRLLLAKILTGTAIVILCVSLIQFFKSKTTIDPTAPAKSKKLVTNGFYKFSRNPMYLAMLLLLLALGLKFGNAFNVLLAAGFVSFMNRFQIIPEERMLLEKFGREFKDYCTITRRWF
ncbi:methyltransferase family protein [Maribacter aestuarii]|uniref:methyltransferase family protein n=1 Tax=Maribacter aestuarii TaxID=1130723 RepID=UPI00248B8E4A|nr:isoprenylcysteine carboxylmethyltransferase family protein [Maribacter aestuarii]